MSRGRLYITLAALQCIDSKELNSFLFAQHPQIDNAYVTEGKITLKYKSKSEFLGKKRLRLIRLNLLTNPLLSSNMCFVHVSLLSMVTPNSLELEHHFMRCWLIFKLPKGPISLKDHSLALFGVWHQRVVFAPEGEFLYSFVQRCYDLVYGFTDTVHGSVISIQERRRGVNCLR